MKYLYFFISVFLSAAVSTGVHAQTKVTFRVNLKPMLEDSSFVPGQDVLEVSGDLMPFSRTKRFELRDEAPADSIYSVTVEFPRRWNDHMLNFTYIIRSRFNLYKEKQEAFPRMLELKTREITTRALLFDTYAN